MNYLAQYKIFQIVPFILGSIYEFIYKNDMVSILLLNLTKHYDYNRRLIGIC